MWLTRRPREIDRRGLSRSRLVIPGFGKTDQIVRIQSRDEILDVAQHSFFGIFGST